MDWELIVLDRSKNATIPIFKQIANLLLRNIEQELLKPGDKLPTEREIALRCGVARGTAKNAFKQLEKDKIIETIQGSGSYVRKGQGALEYRQKKEAMELIATTVKKIRSLDVSDREIADLFQIYLQAGEDNTVRIAIVDNNLEAMLDLSRQLSELFPSISLSVLILESITMTADPEHLFDSFDLMIVDSTYYQNLLSLSPSSREKNHRGSDRSLPIHLNRNNLPKSGNPHRHDLPHQCLFTVRQRPTTFFSISSQKYSIFFRNGLYH